VNNKLPGFWVWFFRGTGERAGLWRLFDSWLIAHVVIGTALAYLVQRPIGDVAEKALIPMMAIFVGLTFSWAGNAHALLQSKEVVNLGKSRSGGIFEYVYTFQLCILVMLLTIIAWVVPLLNLPFLLNGFIALDIFNRLASVVLFTLISLAFRTSWQAVLGANMLLLIRVKSDM
jgi:hypothetical protein